MPRSLQKNLWNKIFNNDSINAMIRSGLLYYPHLHRLLSSLKQSQWQTSEELTEHQNERLKKLITHAYENIPYYRHSFDKTGLLPQDIRSVDDLHKLPFLTKDQARNNIESLKAQNYPSNRFELRSTGGATGEPFRFYIEQGKTAVSHFAYFLIMMQRAECTLSHRYLFIIRSNEFWKHQAFGRILTLSPYSLREENLDILFKKIQKLDPHYIIGFPSGISLLSHLLGKKRDELFTNLRAVLCSGETFYEWQRKYLENVFHCRIFSFYAQAEQVVFAATCECSNSYHVFPEYGVTELIDDQGQVITQEGKQGEIVGTGFTNDLFPFIRYRTGDIGEYTKHLCSCGRQYPLLKKIEGRTQEFIINKSGNELPLTGMYATVPFSSDQVKEYQFVQREPGELVVKIVRGEGYTNKDERSIVQGLVKNIGPGFDISVHYVDSVTRTPAGKIRFLIKR